MFKDISYQGGNRFISFQHLMNGRDIITLLRRLKQEGHEYKASLGCTVCSRTAWTTQQDFDSKNKTKNIF
jgi:hypothetical protein